MKKIKDQNKIKNGLERVSPIVHRPKSDFDI